MHKLRISIFLFLLLNTPYSINAQEDGGMPGEFLRWGIGGRALGMGRAYTALAEDATACYWNPAGLAEDITIYTSKSLKFFDMQRFRGTFAYSRLFGETNFCFGTVSFNYSRYASFGLALMQLSTGDIQGWEDINGIVRRTDTFESKKTAFLVSWAGRFKYWKTLDVGVTGKYIENFFTSYGKESCIGFDLGVRWQPFFQPIYFGLNFQNADAVIRTIKLGEDVIPWSIRGGIGWLPFSKTNFKLAVALDYEYIYHGDMGLSRLRGGLDFKFLNKVSLRIGCNHNEFTVGFGISNINFSSLNLFTLDYAHGFHRSESELKPCPRISFSFDGQLQNYKAWYEEAIANSDSEKSKYLLRKIIYESTDKKWIILAYAALGDYEYKATHYAAALDYYNKAKKELDAMNKQQKKELFAQSCNFGKNEINLKFFRLFLYHVLTTRHLVKQNADYHSKADEIDSWYQSFFKEYFSNWCCNYYSAVIYHKSAEIDSAEKSWESAIQTYKYLIDDTIKTTDALRQLFRINLGICNLRAGKNEAKEIFESITQEACKISATSDPLKIFTFEDTLMVDDAHYYLGELYLSKNDTDRAILEYAKIALLYPELEKVSSAKDEINKLILQNSVPDSVQSIPYEEKWSIENKFKYPSDFLKTQGDFIYVANSGNKSIEKLAPKIEKNYQNYGTLTCSYFAYPTGIAIKEPKSLFIADPRANRLSKYDLNYFGNCMYDTLFATKTSFVEKPIDVFISEESEESILYIADYCKRYIYKYNINSNSVIDSLQKLLLCPTNVVVDNENRDIYVIDWGYQKILKFTSKFELDTTFDSYIGKSWWPIYLYYLVDENTEKSNLDNKNNKDRKLYVIYKNVLNDSSFLVKLDLDKESNSPEKIGIDNSLRAIYKNAGQNIIYILEYGPDSRIKVFVPRREVKG